jgi:heme-degrading monooxygenase HmoA
MIERVWLARAANRENFNSYEAYFRRVVLPELNAVGGYRGAKLVQRDRDGGVEIIVVTYWDSLDAVRGFAGDDINRAHVRPEAAALFTDYDRSARHYEIVFEERR